MYGTYKACAKCAEEAKRYADQKDMEAWHARQERDDAVARLQAKERCIDWVWCVRWTTPTTSGRSFCCHASEAVMRVFASREDALHYVKSIRERFAAVKKRRDEELKARGCGITFGPTVGGDTDQRPSSCGNYVDFGGEYSVSIQCMAVNHSACDVGREFDFEGNVKEVAQ